MSSPEFLIIKVLKLLAEIGLLSMLAQGIVGFLSGRAKENNFVYRLLQIVTGPIYQVTRKVIPKFIPEQYHGMVGFLVMFWIWVALIYAKAYVCHSQNLACFPT
jgi:hypothetical protein